MKLFLLSACFLQPQDTVKSYVLQTEHSFTAEHEVTPDSINHKPSSWFDQEDEGIHGYLKVNPAQPDIVINLVGILSGDFDAVQHEGAANVAKAAAAAGVTALVHVSAIGADANSPSAYGRSKAAGEAAVLAAFPTATILRPSIIFGQEDQFLNRFAGVASSGPVVPVIGGATKFQPVYVGDVAEAIANAAQQPGVYGGKTFELAGPPVMSMKEINAGVARAIGRGDKPLVDVPGAFASLLAMLPGGPITRDQLAMLGQDNVAAPGAPGLEALGVAPTPMAAVAEPRPPRGSIRAWGGGVVTDRRRLLLVARENNVATAESHNATASIFRR